MKIQTTSGFVCEIDENKVRDWRFVKNLAKCEDMNTMPICLAFCVPFILGEDGENALMEHIKEDSGLIATDKVLTEFREILDKIKENNEIKKSSSSQA